MAAPVDFHRFAPLGCRLLGSGRHDGTNFGTQMEFNDLAFELFNSGQRDEALHHATLAVKMSSDLDFLATQARMLASTNSPMTTMPALHEA